MRIGVFVCQCGTNIAGTVSISKVVEAAKKMPMVAYVDDNKYTCSDPGQASIREAILKHHLDRVVVASCSPLMHEPTFCRTIAAAGLNPYLLEMANIREQCSWVHSDKEAATDKAIGLVRMAVAKVSRNEELFFEAIGITKRALVIGGGIAGMQAALDIANAGYETVLVEREPTIGGRMDQLDKTFPTLACSACILTPKMVDVARHPNITLLTCSQVESLQGFIGNFKVKIIKKARYVDENRCTGCGECAQGCPVTMSSEFELGMRKRKAAYIPFPQAVPNIYTIDKREERPCKMACRDACPVLMNVPGYIDLIKEGDFKEAYELIRRTNPLPAVCGRVCYAPCEDACNRGQIDEPMAIRELKRFVANQIDIDSLELPRISRNGKKVAIIGSGPAGLSAANDLALWGYEVTIFEALPDPGGMLRYAIPDYRLPKDVLRKEIGYIERLGVEIKTNIKVGDDIRLEDLRKAYQAIFIATGSHESLTLRIPGEDFPGVIHISVAEVDHDKCVACLTCVRVCPYDVPYINAEGVAEIELARCRGCGICAAECPRRAIKPLRYVGVDIVIPALEQVSNLDFRMFKELSLEISRRGTISVDEALATSVEGVFAGGDVVTGPDIIINAIAAGKKAARSIDEYLKGEPLTSKEDKRTPEKLSEEEVAEIKKRFPSQNRVKVEELELKERVKGFEEMEKGYIIKQAQEEARRCLASQIEGCIGCGECEERCEAEAINYGMQDKDIELDVGAIIMATGYHIPDLSTYEVYGGGKYPDVISALQLERLMSSFGPTGGEIVRPSDGTHPKTVVFIGCVGSRDEKTGSGYCSRVCCMYMAKQAIMLKEHDAEVQSYILYPTVRGPGGKMFEEFLERAQKEAGAIYLRGEIIEVHHENKKIMVRGNDLEKDEPVNIPADLVVLAVGMTPSIGVQDLARTLNISYDNRNFMLEAHPKLRPVETRTDGVFLAGTCLAPFDIPESVAQGGAAASYVVSLFSHDTLEVGGSIAQVDRDKCVACLTCARVCPYNVPYINGEGVAKIEVARCRGCGICAAECPRGAIKLLHYKEEQVMAKSEALLAGV